MSDSSTTEVPVLITIDLDGDLPLLAADSSNVDRQKARSVGSYGLTEGAPRLLRMLKDLQISATWFVPGLVVSQRPDIIRTIDTVGHDLGTLGYSHADFDKLTLDEQVSEMHRGSTEIQKITGQSVSGFRVPEGEWKNGFLEAMSRRGFLWSSSLPSDDRPFLLGDTGLVEIPWRYELEDLQYLAFNLEPEFPPGQSRIASHRTVFENWAIEWEAAKHFGTFFVLRLNAEVIGTPGRIIRLREFLEKIAEDPASRLSTCAQVANDHAMNSTNEAEHPYKLWESLLSEQSAATQ